MRPAVPKSKLKALHAEIQKNRSGAIRLEFTSSIVDPIPKILQTQTILFRELGLPEDYSETYCVSKEQTLAEKIVGLLSKVDSITTGADDRLVRHISDIHEITLSTYDPESFIKSFENAVEEDLRRFPKRSQDLRLKTIKNLKLAKLWSVS